MASGPSWPRSLPAAVVRRAVAHWCKTPPELSRSLFNRGLLVNNPGCVRGAGIPVPKLTDPPVNARRRESPSRCFAFSGFLRRVSADPTGGRILSVSKETNRGPKPTLKVGSAPRNLGQELSESLINNASGFNNPVGFESAKPTGCSERSIASSGHRSTAGLRDSS
jgi:hypothetical protein